MQMILVAQITASIGVPLMLGPVVGGLRAVVPITSGSVDGPRLRGTVEAMGADWALLQPDGSALVDARYVLRMTDGTLVGIRNRGLAQPAADREGVYEGQSTPVFEAPAGSPHDWLNHATFTCRFTSDLTLGEVRLSVFQIAPPA